MHFSSTPSPHLISPWLRHLSTRLEHVVFPFSSLQGALSSIHPILLIFSLWIVERVLNRILDRFLSCSIVALSFCAMLVCCSVDFCRARFLLGAFSCCSFLYRDVFAWCSDRSVTFLNDCHWFTVYFCSTSRIVAWRFDRARLLLSRFSHCSFVFNPGISGKALSGFGILDNYLFGMAGWSFFKLGKSGLGIFKFGIPGSDPLLSPLCSLRFCYSKFHTSFRN